MLGMDRADAILQRLFADGVLLTMTNTGNVGHFLRIQI